jgi:hypothetical protein
VNIRDRIAFAARVRPGIRRGELVALLPASMGQVTTAITRMRKEGRLAPPSTVMLTGREGWAHPRGADVLAMLADGPMTYAEIQERLGLSVTRTRVICGALVRDVLITPPKGLVCRSPSEAARFRRERAMSA